MREQHSLASQTSQWEETHAEYIPLLKTSSGGNKSSRSHKSELALVQTTTNETGSNNKNQQVDKQSMATTEGSSCNRLLLQPDP
jgi:hypothetical protein